MNQEKLQQDGTEIAAGAADEERRHEVEEQDSALMSEWIMNDEDVPDPQFQAFMAYIEGAAQTLVAELRDAEPEPVVLAAPVSDESNVSNAVEPDSDELEPGTAEYDQHHGIPHYEVR